jgi:hypothetical protein
MGGSGRSMELVGLKEGLSLGRPCASTAYSSSIWGLLATLPLFDSRRCIRLPDIYTESNAFYASNSIYLCFFLSAKDFLSLVMMGIY